jgi:carbon monoxide dehydrogenase subunit G
MELQGERLIPADVQRTWDALNDPEILKDCVPGCESLERTGDNSFEALVAVKVGPVSARFKGRLQMTNIEPPRAYTINFDGQGGAAGFSKGSADVSLLAEGAATRLRYDARAQVGGKMAQIGSRLIDAAAAKITEEFFSKFEQRLKPPAEEAPAVETAAAAAAAGPAPVGAPAKRAMPASWWIAVAVVVAGAIYFVMR